MSKVLISSLCMIFLHGASFAMNPAAKPAPQKEKVAALKATAEQYRIFLDQFGKIDPKDANTMLPSMKQLFDPNCKKVVNDEVVSSTIPGLHKQISDGKGPIGTWAVTKAGPYVADPEENLVIAHFRIPTEKQGTIVVMKYLFCNSQGLIKEINEVFNTTKK